MEVIFAAFIGYLIYEIYALGKTLSQINEHIDNVNCKINSFNKELRLLETKVCSLDEFKED